MSLKATVAELHQEVLSIPRSEETHAPQTTCRASCHNPWKRRSRQTWEASRDKHRRDVPSHPPLSGLCALTASSFRAPTTPDQRLAMGLAWKERSKNTWLASKQAHRKSPVISLTPATPMTMSTMSTMSTTPTSTYREDLIAFYTCHNPSKVDAVETTLSKYKGRETEMFARLKAKYGVNAVPLAQLSRKWITHAGQPTVFMDLAIAQQPLGRIVIRCCDVVTPLTTANFIQLCTGLNAAKLSYQHSTFHRVIKHFMVQGGDITKGDGTGGASIYYKTPHGNAWGKFKDESFTYTHDDVGRVSMANSGPHSNSSQFFITTSASLPQLDQKHVVFGEVLEGMDLIDRLQHVQTHATTSCPLEAVTITHCGALFNVP